MATKTALLRTSTFRFALLYAAVFATSVLLLLVFLYWATAGYMARQADATIDAEIEGLAEQYRREGLERLSEVIAERIARDPGGKSVYLFAGADYRALAGNMNAWPKADVDAQGWLEFSLNASDGVRRARARAFVLGRGLRLLVGRDVQELRDVGALILTALVWGFALMLATASVAGIALSRRVLRRIDAINATSAEIMAGDLGRRIPISARADDFDQLAGNLNHMLDEIERLMRSVKQVSDNVAHDLRTPLTRLRTRLEALATHVHKDAPASELASAALEDADQLLAAFSALLRIARLESGNLQLVAEALDVSALARDAYDLYEAIAESRGLRLRLRLDGTSSVLGDRDLLFQALGNLLENALKFTPSGGEVSIETRSRSGVVELSVIDDGPGIAASERGRVMERFYRADASRSTPGQGLGLSLVSAIAQHHNARVALFDNAPGLTATISIPAFTTTA
jgi:signal transduction histidine kinase